MNGIFRADEGLEELQLLISQRQCGQAVCGTHKLGMAVFVSFK